jgi:hypothetical protein
MPRFDGTQRSREELAVSRSVEAEERRKVGAEGEEGGTNDEVSSTAEGGEGERSANVAVFVVGRGEGEENAR